MDLSIIVVSLDIEDAKKHLLSLRKLVNGRKNIEILIIYGRGKQDNQDIEKTIRFIHQEPAGIYAAMNMGYSESVGEWVYFSNPGDDLLLIPDISLLSGMLTCFPVRVISEDGSSCYDRLPRMPKRLMPPHQGMFLNKTLFNRDKKCTPFDERLSFCGDLDFFLSLKVSLCDIVYYRCPFVSNFRLGGVSNNPKYLLNRKAERFRVLRRYYGFLTALKNVI